MIDKEIREHSFVKYASDLEEICHALFSNSPVNFFEPCRIYKNNDYSGFMTDAIWAEHFLKQNYQDSGIGTYASDILTSDFTLWTASGMWDINECSREMGSDCVAFNYGNGLTLIERYEEYTQLYYFAADSGANFINQFFINNIDKLAEFVLYFKEKLAENKELQEAYQKRYSAKTPEIVIPFSNETIEELPITKYYLDDQTYLTVREIECFRLMKQGNTAKEIGKILHISPRTVEEYIKQVTNKLKCKNAKEALSKLLCISSIKSIL